MLELNNICKSYPSPSSEGFVTVLSEVFLLVKAGESIAIIGPSGSGKTTLLNLIGALDQPTTGSINLFGSDLADLNDIQRAKIRNQDIGFIFQLHHLLPQCTVLENVLIPTIPFGLKEERDNYEKQARELLSRVGLGGHLNYFPPQLSGGELQRVAVARALINQPKLLLADEPTGALDKKNADKLGQLLISLNKEKGSTLIVVTHSRDLAQNMDRIFSLIDGQLIPSK